MKKSFRFIVDCVTLHKKPTNKNNKKKDNDRFDVLVDHSKTFSRVWVILVPNNRKIFEIAPWIYGRREVALALVKILNVALKKNTAPQQQKRKTPTIVTNDESFWEW
jgi:hypothetical protein